MRKLFVTILAAVLGVAAYAQGDSLDKLLAAIGEESASFEYTFASSGQVKMTGSGTVKVQDKSYYLSGNGLEVWSDGESIWTLDRSAKELIIEATADSGMGITNPAQFLSVAGEAFNRQLATSSMVVLVPKDRSEIKQIKLYMNDAAKPVLTKVSVTVSDGTVTDFTIKNFKYTKKEPSNAFAFDEKTLSKEYLVTDLR